MVSLSIEEKSHLAVLLLLYSNWRTAIGFGSNSPQFYTEGVAATATGRAARAGRTSSVGQT